MLIVNCFTEKSVSASRKDSTSIACYQLENIKDAKKFGVISIDENNKIINIEEKPREPKSNLVVTGIYIIKKEDIKKMLEFLEISRKEGRLNPSFSLTFFMIDLYKKQSVFAFPFQGEWIDIGSLEDYEKVK